jgi:hypothetical protein
MKQRLIFFIVQPFRLRVRLFVSLPPIADASLGVIHIQSFGLMGIYENSKNLDAFALKISCGYHKKTYLCGEK